MQMSRSQKNNKGVTLIEMILVVLLLGIVAVTVSARWPSSSDMTLGPQAGLFAQNLRHLQALAVQQGKTLTMDSTSSGYSGEESTVVITEPIKGSSFQVTLENSVTMSVASVDFDEMGRPETTGSGTLISTVQDFVLTGSSNSITVSVTPVTGYVYITP